MPKTRFQDLIFTVIMVLIFVYVMTFYNAGLESGVTLGTFGYALRNMWVEAIGAFIIQRYIAAPLVKRLVRRVFTPGEDKSIFIILATAGFTVSIMAPAMTLYVSIYHMGLCPELLGHWLSKLVMNFPFALCAQVFYVGPLVRLIFRTLFREGRTAAAMDKEQAGA